MDLKQVTAAALAALGSVALVIGPARAGDSPGTSPGPDPSFIFTGITQSLSGNTLSATGPNKAIIDGNAFSNASGSIAVNVASGVGIEQSNVLVVAPNSVLGSFSASVSQSLSGLSIASAGINRAVIGGNAFSNASGVIAVNLSAGAGNLQSNVIYSTLPYSNLPSAPLTSSGSPGH